MSQIEMAAIRKDIISLSSVDLNALFNELIARKVIDEKSVEQIKAKQKEEVFVQRMSRHSAACQVLIESLEKIGCIDEADLLRKESKLQNGTHEYGTDAEEMAVNGTSSLQGSEQKPQRASKNFKTQPPLVINVTPAKIYNAGKNNTHCYPMMSNPRGFALVINNIEFIGDCSAIRKGAKYDTGHLENLFKQLGFTSMIEVNVKKKELDGIIKKFIKKFEDENFVPDACVVCIMSHGDRGSRIRTHDSENENYTCFKIQKNTYWDFYEDILSKFNNKHCPILKGKPKIFIVQACQGGKIDQGVSNTYTDGKDMSNTAACAENPEVLLDIIPETEDMIVCYSTHPGYVSFRDPKIGTWYINTLCRIFMEHAHNTEILRLLQMVGKEMRKFSSVNNEKQMSAFHVLGLHHKIYFNPALYQDQEASLSEVSNGNANP